MSMTNQLNRALRVEMARVGVDQRSVALALGLSGAAISRRMTGATPWTVDEVDRVADFLGLDITDLFTSLDRQAAS